MTKAEEELEKYEVEKKQIRTEGYREEVVELGRGEGNEDMKEQRSGTGKETE